MSIEEEKSEKDTLAQLHQQPSASTSTRSSAPGRLLSSLRRSSGGGSGVQQAVGNETVGAARGAVAVGVGVLRRNRQLKNYQNHEQM